MIKHDVAALIGHRFAAGLDWVLQNLIHPAHVGAHGNDGCQILQSALHRIVHPGSCHQEKKQR